MIVEFNKGKRIISSGDILTKNDDVLLVVGMGKCDSYMLVDIINGVRCTDIMTQDDINKTYSDWKLIKSNKATLRLEGLYDS